MACNQFHDLRAWHWKLLNSANIVLLPKKGDALLASDYRPVSLMHSTSKILCKMLVMRLAPELNALVSPNQSAFIKGRCIHDNFLDVRSVIKEAHCKKQPLVFMKLDIAKAFDSVNWGYIIEVMQQMGFGQRWRDMISLLFASSSSKVMLNGIPGDSFIHRRGLRQGDPLSPMLFILAMELLRCLFDKATEASILSLLSSRSARLRMSFYADDDALFINPVKEEISAVRQLLTTFGEISGLKTSLGKCIAYGVKCEGLDMQDILMNFVGIRGQLKSQSTAAD